MELHEHPPPYGLEDELAEPPRCGIEELPPAGESDPLLKAFKEDVDRTPLRENLKLTPEQRGQKFLRFMEMAYEVMRAGERSRKLQRSP
jgi:hypothetical protein